ncbi:hypothetical protein [Horticoccus sp. 23ND18S-11]|uniref:hypothetical protein n=1 Tax=Horticoccus sp. 23ND18S-11 TaxID=3391832 RepID=UPI0039C8F66A
MRKSLLTFALAGCLFLLIVGAKWATFDRYGSPMPDWDQWDAEALQLLVPWYEKDHFLQHLFTPHNEHRVVLTKLQNLGLTVLNGQWDSRLEAATNALLHAAIAVAFWLCARRWVAVRWHTALFLLAFALFGFPLAWQNILGGFHSQQFWLLGLSFGAIVTLPFARTGSGRWWFGLGCAILVLGSMGSGMLASAVVFMVVAWRLLRRETTLRAAWLTLLLTAALVAIGLITRVEVDYHQKLKATTVHDFVFSCLRSLEWPLRDRDWAGAIVWLPWVIAAWRVTRAPRDQPDAAGVSPSPPAGSQTGQVIVALGGWVLVQIVATAYARGAGADYPASRYMDTLAFGAMANGAALAWLLSIARGEGDTAPRLARYAVALAWLIAVGLGLRAILEINLRYELPDARKYYNKAEGHMRRYLATNDRKQLAHPDIPFPSADGLVDRLARPSLRALMPLPVRAPLTMARATAATPSLAETFRANTAIDVDIEHPPRLGLSPATPPLDYTTTHGSFAPAGDGGTATGTWRSEPLTAPIGGWLKFETAGDLGVPGAGVSLRLLDPQTGRVLSEVAPTKRPGDTWRAAYVRAPHGPFVIAANDESSRAWLAFSPPVEMGVWSYRAWQLTKHGLLIMYVTAGVTLLLLVIAWRESRSSPRATV